MNLLATTPLLKIRSNKPKQVISDSWAERDAILKSNTNLFCWRRTLDPRISSHLKRILEKELPPICFHSSMEELDHHLREAQATWGSETSEASHLFWSDVERLIKDFLFLTNKGSGTVHLKVIDNDACTKFHTDGYPLRLFTTYIGEGTQWLPEEAARRSALGTTNDKIVKEAHRIQQMDTGHVGILKGELPGRKAVTKGIVHRSPAISHTGEKRIILRVDI